MEPIFEKENVKIYVDEDPINPRKEYDNIGTMVCFHHRYTLGDTPCEYSHSDYNGWDEMEQAIIKDHGPCVILPVYLMDHSGLSVSTKPFGCPWDSGQVGFAYVSEARAIEQGIKDIDACLKAEVEAYDQYLRGEVYGYVKTNPKYTTQEIHEKMVLVKEVQTDVCLCAAYGTYAANLISDALNAYDPEEESCWGFYGYEPEELAEVVLKGEV